MWGALAVSGHTGFAPFTARVLHCSGCRLLYREWALRCVRFQFSGVPQRRRLGCACVLCLPHPSSSGSQELDERTLPGCSAPYPPAHARSQPQFPRAPVEFALCLSGKLVTSRDPRWMSTIQNLRKSLVRNWEPVCSLVGDAVSGAEFAPFPSLPPASGDGPVCLRQALFWNCSFHPLFLSNATRSSPFSPHLLVADASVWGTFLLWVAFRHVICGFYLFFLSVRLVTLLEVDLVLARNPDECYSEMSGILKENHGLGFGRSCICNLT